MPPDLERIEKALNAKRWCWIYRDLGSCPQTLAAALQRELPHLSPADWRDRFELGGVFVNGLPTTDWQQPLEVPCKVEYFELRCGPTELEASLGHFDPSEHILYEDQDLIAVFKPRQLPTLAVREQRRYNLHRQLEAYTGQAVHLPSRLDYSTAGVLIGSKAARTHGGLQRLFERREVIKTYLAEVTGALNRAELVVDAAISKDPRHPVLRTSKSGPGLSARTSFTRLGLLEHAGQVTTLLRAQPHSGRTHQIRVHCADMDHPLVGDNFYGGPPAAELHLLSYQLLLKHPTTAAPLAIQVPDRLLPQWLRRWPLDLIPKQDPLQTHTHLA